MRTTLVPHGSTDVYVSGTQFDTAPIAKGGKWEVWARGTHRSWTNVAIDAIGVEGELILNAGGEQYTDSESQGWLLSDEARATTRASQNRNQGEWVYGEDLPTVSAEASSIHQFYDIELLGGEWFEMESEAMGGF